MRKTKKSNLEPYEDILRLDEIDPYEARIESNVLPKQKTNLLNKISFTGELNC